MTYRIDDWEFELGDDGTLDTVIYVYHNVLKTGYISRFNCEFAAAYRDDTGTMTQAGFAELCECALDDALRCGCGW